MSSLFSFSTFPSSSSSLLLTYSLPYGEDLMRDTISVSLMENSMILMMPSLSSLTSNVKNLTLEGSMLTLSRLFTMDKKTTIMLLSNPRDTDEPFIPS